MHARHYAGKGRQQVHACCYIGAAALISTDVAHARNIVQWMTTTEYFILYLSPYPPMPI